ncbi:MAG: zinc-binding dehydrogenase [Longimicrobiaceae bacterium]
MRAVAFHEHGGPEVLRLEERPRPEPGRGEVLVEVRAVGLNHLDLWVRRGLPIEIEMPHIGGSDLAGVVAAVGEGVERVEGGERVVVNPALGCGRCSWCAGGEVSLCADFKIIGEHLNGGLAEYALAPAGNVYRLPDSLSFEQAAGLPVSYQTAWRALLTRARLRPGEDVLVLGGSGGTAIASVQIAKLAGARVFAVTSGAGNVRRVRELGADFVYDRTSEDFSRAVYRDTGKRGVDVVVENVGTATWTGSMRALARGGRLVTYGATSGAEASLDLRQLYWRQLEVIGTTMASVPEFEAVLRASFRGGLTPVIAKTFPLEEAARAHRYLEEGRQFGKVIIVL